MFASAKILLCIFDDRDSFPAISCIVAACAVPRDISGLCPPLLQMSGPRASLSVGAISDRIRYMDCFLNALDSRKVSRPKTIYLIDVYSQMSEN